MPEISVVVPVYKTQKYIRECIDSILAQTFADFELILVDDGSPDDCGKICDEYVKRDNRIKVVHQQNGGLSAARNSGVSSATCAWCCFIDSDDCIHPDMLKIMMQQTDDSRVNMVVCDCVQSEIMPGNFSDPVSASFTTKVIDEECLVELFDAKKRAYWTVVPILIKTAVVRKYPFAVGRIFEDNAVSVYFLTEAKTVAFSEAKLYFYRVNPDGIVHSEFGAKNLDFLWALEQQLILYKKNGYDKMRGRISRQYILDSMWFAKRAQNELNDSRLARSIIRGAVKMRNANSDCSLLTDSEEKKLFKVSHPVIHRLKKHFDV